MDIRQLRYLVSLSRERHFARAAEACGVAQPTLSAGLRHLEDELGVPVVERGNRFKGFTPEGERVLAWAQRILADCESLEQELLRSRKSVRGRLVLGVIPAALTMVARLVRELQARQPGVAVRVLTNRSVGIQRGLDAFELHAGVTYLDNEPLIRVRSLPLYQERYVLLAPGGQDLAGRQSIGWAEAAELPLCLMVPEMQNRRIVDAAFEQAGAQPVPLMESDSMAAILCQVREGGSCAVVPDHLLGRLGGEGLLALPLTAPEIVRTVGLVVADREPTPPLVAELWAVAKTLQP
ncbi:MAG: LysR family transcriptional regulator [Geminicoccaceae bacterium]